MVEVLAWCGAALSCLLSIPQAIRVLRAERLDGISASTYMIVLSNAAIWAAWSLLAREYAAGIPGLVNGPAAILILHRLMVARQKRRIEKPDGSLVGRRAATGIGICGFRVAYSRAMRLNKASSTIILRPTIGTLVGKVTTSGPLARGTNAAIVLITHASTNMNRTRLRPVKGPNW
jgi:uncharacterized protein with PQ loop repeat